MSQPNPTLAELEHARNAMQAEMLQALRDAVSKFKAATGLTPTDIQVGINEIKMQGWPRPEYEVYRVRCVVDVLV